MKRALRLLTTLAVTALAGTLTGMAAASGPVGVGAPVEGPPPQHGGLETGNKRAYWARGVHRPYFSSIVDFGYLYLRPQIAVGWGKPHWHFVQAEGYAGFSGSGIGQYAGIRAALPLVELRVGARYQASYQRAFMARKDTYNRRDLEQEEGPASRYMTIEAEMIATAAILHGSVFALAGVYFIRGVPSGYDVYEEQLRVIARHEVIRVRLGHALRLGQQGAVRIGPVVEAMFVPARSAQVWRAGIVASVVLDDHWEVLATFVPVIRSPDQFGLAGGDFGQLGVRYRWAAPKPPLE